MRRRLLPVAGLVLLALITAVATRSVVGAVKRKAQRAAARPPAQFTFIPGPTLTIKKAAGGQGELDVEAVASVGHPLMPKDQTLTWYLKVSRQTGPGGYEVVWQQQYDHQSFRVPAGQVQAPTFAEHLVMPPGTYTVGVGLAKWSTVINLNPNPQAYPVVSELARVTVR